MRIFGRSRAKLTPGESVGIHIHEDDWGMRNLYPAQAFGEVQNDLDRSIQASVDNRAEDGMGWTAVHEIENPANDYAAAGLRIKTASEVVSALLPRINNFTPTAMPAIDGLPLRLSQVRQFTSQTHEEVDCPQYWGQPLSQCG